MHFSFSAAHLLVKEDGNFIYFSVGVLWKHLTTLMDNGYEVNGSCFC